MASPKSNWCPTLDFSPPELTGAPKRLSGYFIPAGTPVVVDVHRLSTHPSVWGADSLVFRPERFKDMAPSQWRYGLIRFGIASGRCLGKNMADLILKMVAAGVVEKFELKKAESGVELGEGGKGKGKGKDKGGGFVAEVEFKKR
jgi:cytochrome P450